MTLTEAAQLTRKSTKYAGFAVLTIIVFWVIYQIVNITIIRPYQEKQIKPDYKLGLLPHPNYPKSIASSSELNYSLDTATGELPTVTSQKLIKVFFIPPSSASLLSSENARKLAVSLGFLKGADIISETNYQFKDNYKGVLNVDINTGNFSFNREVISFINNETDTPTDSFASPDNIGGSFKNYLNKNGLLNDQLKDGITKVTFNKGNSKDSNLATVNLWPIDIDKLPIVTPKFSQSLITANVSKYNNDINKYLSIDYTFWLVDINQFGTYFVKTVANAYKDLTSGQGVVIINNDKTKASITDVYLAYFESKEYFPYLVPVYVFKGDNFVAYVEAITQDSFKSD